MVRWKGYGPEHDKWVKHSDVFAKDAIDAYYRRYPNAPRQIASAAFDSLSFRRCDRTIRFICRNTVFQGGGVMSGEPPLFRPFRLFLRLPLWPPLQLTPPTLHPPVLVGACYVTRPMIIVDTSGHVLLGSY
jgi:hypothetical protein